MSSDSFDPGAEQNMLPFDPSRGEPPRVDSDETPDDRQTAAQTSEPVQSNEPDQSNESDQSNKADPTPASGDDVPGPGRHSEADPESDEAAGGAPAKKFAESTEGQKRSDRATTTSRQGGASPSEAPQQSAGGQQPADEQRRRPAPRPRPASIPDHLITVEDHLEKILLGVGPLEPYDQPLVESLGLPIHTDFVAQHDLPRFDNSAMDGYAVRAQDVTDASETNPVTLPVVGEIAAGSARPFAISANTAVKIMTGAPIPRGADAIVPIEATDRGNARVVISKSATVGAHIRRRAGDVAVGDVVLTEGTVLGPREVGLLASLGAPRVKSRPRPRVVVISTGTELREPGGHLEYDSIFDGNSYMLAAAIRKAGAIAYRVGAVDDNPKTFRKTLSEQLVRADIVVTSGGISKGDHDVVKEALAPLGTVEFSQVAMQPGKPQGFGTVFEEQTPIITLPGNSVSAFVSFEVFVLPAIRRMMGLTPYRRPMVHAVLAADLSSPTGRRQYVRAVFEVTHRGAKVTPIEGSGSHLIGGLAKSNALIVVGEDESALNMGDTVRTLVLDRPF